MDSELLNSLRMITPEEQKILDGKTDVEKSLYSTTKEFVIDSGKMLERGKLIDLRPNTRFVHFPKHRHNYVEIIYMCSGTTTHIINGQTTITLKQGELLFLNQNASQEILPAGENDIAINFIILPEFFDMSFSMMKDENVLRDFLVGSLRKDFRMGDYLHFQVTDILPIQNLMENMIWSLLNKQPNRRYINQTTMGLLFLQLINCTDRISQNNPAQYEQNLVFTCLKYIEENYKTSSLTELAKITSLPVYQLSRLIKQYSHFTFTELLQQKRLNQAAFLLSTTKLPVEHIIAAVGYDNTSYFHKIFRKHFLTTPRSYRCAETDH